jgi:hypothetical protein
VLPQREDENRNGGDHRDKTLDRLTRDHVSHSLRWREFPTVYKAIDDLKRKDYRHLASLLQAHESKIMIDIICRRILNELPGTFIATIHDLIMTNADKADEVKAIMVREFQRFGLNSMIRLEAY